VLIPKYRHGVLCPMLTLSMYRQHRRWIMEVEITAGFLVGVMVGAGGLALLIGALRESRPSITEIDTYRKAFVEMAKPNTPTELPIDSTC
jgi:hypothetical protein